MADFILMPAEHGLPAELNSFVGRDAELQSIAQALTSARLLTLAGPGGCGKTRLAARVAGMGSGIETGDVWWVDLTATSDPAIVPELVADTLGALHAPNQDAIGAVAQQLLGRRILLCLDNCEHVLEAAADMAGELLRRCPQATILCTSREPLRLPGEVVWRVPPLSSVDSVELFTARAGHVTTSEEAARSVRTACVRLEGMPLAVELAAAWSGTLSPQELLNGLDDRFRLLARGPHGAAARHQTLIACMEWSYDLLDEVDRALFEQLAVFSSGFTAAAAQGVCARDGLDDGAVLDGLRRLIEKSLLVADTRDVVTRYRMLETIREYAEKRLEASGEIDAVRDHHLDVHLTAAESQHHLLDTDKDAWRAVIGADYENLRVAIEWGLAREDPERGRRLAAALPWFWHSSRRGKEGLDLLRSAIELGAADRTELQARLLMGLALVADTTAPVGVEYDVAQAALGIARDVGDRRTACLALCLSGVGMLYNDFQAAWNLASESEAVAREVGDGFVRDGATALMGIVCHLRDEHERAMPLLRAAVEGLVPRGDRGVASTALGYLAISVAHTGDLPRARDLAQQGVSVATPLGDYHRVGSARAVLAQVEELAGRLDEAWAAVAPMLRLIEGAEPIPFIPGFAQCIGYLHLRNGEPERALPWFERDLTMSGELDGNFLAARTRIGLATAQHALGDAIAARDHATIALGVGRDLGMPGLISDALEVLARLIAGTEPQHAEDMHHEALALRVEHGLKLRCVHSLELLADLADRAGSTVESARILGACDHAREELGHPRHRPHTPEADDDHAAGRTMSLDDVISYARRARGTRSRPATGWASLTPTELSVVKLAVAGLTNPEIGRQLFMSRATVKTHLSHVYAKLGINNRTQLATARRG
jgi:predicted ATPase/DNA-binding CsgD family transcriptional regulator